MRRRRATRARAGWRSTVTTRYGSPSTTRTRSRCSITIPERSASGRFRRRTQAPTTSRSIFTGRSGSTSSPRTRSSASIPQPPNSPSSPCRGWIPRCGKSPSTSPERYGCRNTRTAGWCGSWSGDEFPGAARLSKKNGHPKVPVVGIGPETLSHGAPGAAPPVAEAAVREGDEPCCGGAAVAAPIAGTLLGSRRRHFLRRGVCLVTRKQCLAEELNAAFGRQHDAHLHAIGGRVALDDLHGDLRMHVVVVRVLAEPLGGLRAHLDARTAPVRLEAGEDLARDVPGNSLDGEARRGDCLGERALGVDVPQPVGQRLHVPQHRLVAFGQVEHLFPLQAEAHSHPDPMLGMGLFDADIVDQERTRVIILDLDQRFGEELGKSMDERINLQYPSLHLGNRELCGGYAPRPVSVQEAIPIRLDVTVQRIHPLGVSGHFMHRSHSLLLDVVITEMDGAWY